LFEDGDRILVNKYVYRLGAIERGDVVVFWYPRDPSTSFIKRVIGLPGEAVELRNGVVLIDGVAQTEEYVAAGFRDHESRPAVVVAAGHYFVMGDHRSRSQDSRSWGEVPQKYIYGRAALRFWPLTRAGLVH
jgi:signal peptidase I